MGQEICELHKLLILPIYKTTTCKMCSSNVNPNSDLHIYYQHFEPQGRTTITNTFSHKVGLLAWAFVHQILLW